MSAVILLGLLAHAAADPASYETDYGTPDVLGNFAEPIHYPASFSAADGKAVIAAFGERFVFGLATAPAHVEDGLDDAWLEFARAGHVTAYNNTPRADERTRFWSEPEEEIELAAGAGAKIFRMGVDWARLFPTAENGMDNDAWARYRQIMLMCHARGMRVMLTLVHHSLPPWLGALGGWTSADSLPHFRAFARAVLGGIAADPALATAMHSLVTVNEPHVFAMLTYCAGLWPPGAEPTPFESLSCFTPWGNYGISMANMASAHRIAHELVQELNLQLPVGAAHHVPCYDARTVLDKPAQRVSELLTTFYFQDLIANTSDFIGINYYGREIVDGTSIALVQSEEYSEAGRSIYPDGLFRVLVAFSKRYRSIPIFVTENGIADSTDILRPAYLIEHLLAVRAAMDVGVPVQAYIWWTITDNLEWADGYCPRFGLVAMNRTDAAPGLARTPRASYALFRAIARGAGSGPAVTAGQRAEAWELVSSHARRKAVRPFCRAADGKSALHAPTFRRFSTRDWRYGARETGRHGRAERRLSKRLNSSDWAAMADRLSQSWTDSALALQSAIDGRLGEQEAALRASYAELEQSVRAGVASATAAIAALQAKAQNDASNFAARAELAAADWLSAIQREVEARQRRDAAWFRRAWRALGVRGRAAQQGVARAWRSLLARLPRP